MKTFKELTTNDTLNPMFHQYGPTLLGPGMGQYQPVADLNAQRQMLGPNIPQGNFKEIKKSDLDQIEKYADRLFGALDIDVEFTRHFLDRVNDKRNKRPIVPAELTRLFKQTYKKFGKTIRKLGPDAEAVINDMKTDINMPFVLNLKGGELELVAKTVMRKKNFQTSNPKLSFEEIVKEEFKFFPKKLHKRITLPSPPMDLQREADIVKQIMSKRTAKDEESIRNHDENSFYAIEMYCKENGLIFHDNEMKDIVIGARPTIKYFKKLFNLTRPFEFDKSIKPMSSVTNKTRSYPSGHATQSRLVGLYVANKFPEHEKNIMEAAKECAMGRVQAGFHYLADYVAGNLLADKMFLVMNKDDYGKYLDEGIGEPNVFSQKNPRIPRKKGQPAGSDKHSDLYTDENPRGTIHGLGFKDVATARASVKKIENSGKKHAHKIQAAVAMEQRAKEMGKRAEAAIYRAYIEKMKKKTKQMQKEEFKFFPDNVYEQITLPEPPTDIGKKIKTVQKVMNERTEQDEISIRNHDEVSFYAIKKYCDENNLEFHDGEFEQIIEDSASTIKYFKDKFDVARPFEVDKSIKPMESKTNKTRSYPSGHATQATLVAKYVMGKFPEHEKPLYEAAKECGFGRVQAGFHFVSDYVVGNLLGEKLYTIMNKDDYGRYVNEAPDTSDAMKRYKSGKAGFTDIAHLKAKGLIKRSDGTKKKSDKYK